MSARYSPEAKAKEQETRKRLGPRIGAPKNGGHRVTLEPRAPRATGASRWAIRDGKDNNA